MTGNVNEIPKHIFNDGDEPQQHNASSINHHDALVLP